MAVDPRSKSRVLLEGTDRSAARAMMKAVGFSDEDLKRPQIGVAHSWIGTMPCNWNHRKLAEKVMQGVRAAGGTPIEVNTISITDGITMGTEGMKGSLISREVIADSVELVARSHMFDGLVTISGCDKTIPAMAMVLGRVNVPGLMLYCGSIMFGRCVGTTGPFANRNLTIQDVFEAIGAYNAGKISREEFRTSRTTPVRERARAADSSPPIPWPPPTRCSGSRRWDGTTSPPSIPARKRSPSSAARW